MDDQSRDHPLGPSSVRISSLLNRTLRTSRAQRERRSGSSLTVARGADAKSLLCCFFGLSIDLQRGLFQL